MEELKIYVPNLNNQNCVVLQNSTTIRVYQYTPTNNSSVNYRDYYLNMHYYYNTGIQTFSNYQTLPTCRTDITSDIWYRVDIDQILFISFLLSILIFYLPYKLLRKAWYRK